MRRSILKRLRPFGVIYRNASTAFLFKLALATMLVALPSAAIAQYGHPLKGSWSGERTTGRQQARLLINLDWDGRAVSGTINPGPNAITVKKVSYEAADPAAWVVRIEAERKDTSGKVIPVTIEGKLENIGSYRRFITGTWTEGGTKSQFKVTRN
jgi:hypothetical protein